MSGPFRYSAAEQPFVLAKALGDELLEAWCNSNRRSLKAQKCPSANVRKSARRDLGLQRFHVAVADSGERIEIRCKDAATAGWKGIARWHEKVTDVKGYIPVLVIVKVIT